MKVLTRISILFCIVLILFTTRAQELHGHNPVQAEKRMLGKGNPFTIDGLPQGKLKTGLLALPDLKRRQALKWLHSFSFPMQDAVESLRVDKQGGIFYVCAFDAPDNI